MPSEIPSSMTSSSSPQPPSSNNHDDDDDNNDINTDPIEDHLQTPPHTPPPHPHVHTRHHMIDEDDDDVIDEEIDDEDLDNNNNNNDENMDPSSPPPSSIQSPYPTTPIRRSSGLTNTGRVLHHIQFTSDSQNSNLPNLDLENSNSNNIRHSPPLAPNITIQTSGRLRHRPSLYGQNMAWIGPSEGMSFNPAIFRSREELLAHVSYCWRQPFDTIFLDLGDRMVEITSDEEFFAVCDCRHHRRPRSFVIIPFFITISSCFVMFRHVSSCFVILPYSHFPLQLPSVSATSFIRHPCYIIIT